VRGAIGWWARQNSRLEVICDTEDSIRMQRNY
jgi:hypothetical protein